MCAEAIAAREQEVGAFAALDFLDAARRHAQESRILPPTPLRGLPVAFKDIFDTADFPTEYGSPIYAGYRPRADATAVALTRRAGGIVIGKTVTTEFASMVPAATCNPHHAAHTPGGSSSGSAAAVAAGMVPIAFGTQTAGSANRPAAFCGVTGFKPSYRLIPLVGVKDVAWHLDTAGVFGAGAADVALARCGNSRPRSARRSRCRAGARRASRSPARIWWRRRALRCATPSKPRPASRGNAGRQGRPSSACRRFWKTPMRLNSPSRITRPSARSLLRI